MRHTRKRDPTMGLGRSPRHSLYTIPSMLKWASCHYEMHSYLHYNPISFHSASSQPTSGSSSSASSPPWPRRSSSPQRPASPPSGSSPVTLRPCVAHRPSSSLPRSNPPSDSDRNSSHSDPGDRSVGVQGGTAYFPKSTDKVPRWVIDTNSPRIAYHCKHVRQRHSSTPRRNRHDSL